MDNDFTVNAALVTAMAAILAPTITALIHSVKEYRISKIAHTIDPRLNLFTSFSHAYSNCQYGAEKNGYMSEFYLKTMKLIALCHHRRTRRALFQLANQVKMSGTSKDTDVLFEKCIRLLTKEF